MALFLTIIIEEGTAAIAYPVFQKGGSRLEMALYVLVCNMITNPALNLLVNLLYIRSMGIVLCLEAVVVWVEQQLFLHFSYLTGRQAFFLSLMVNAASFLGGGILIWYFGM